MQGLVRDDSVVEGSGPEYGRSEKDSDDESWMMVEDAACRVAASFIEATGRDELLAVQIDEFGFWRR